MVTARQLAEGLRERFQKKDRESGLDREEFQALFREAVRNYYPELKERCGGRSLYGVSFEIGDTVQSIYAGNFEMHIYFNTEEGYREKSRDCGEDEKDYYRFEPWAEWDVVNARSPLFDRLRDYLEQNSLRVCCECSSNPDYRDRLKDDAAAWYEKNKTVFEKAFAAECRQIRGWMAEALGGLRREGFWEAQGSAELYVIPFGGEGDIGTEELIESYSVMDAGYHGTEYPDYLKSCDLA